VGKLSVLSARAYRGFSITDGPIRIYIEALEEIAYISPVYSKYILRHIDVIILDLQQDIEYYFVVRGLTI
jgi:hypothetical protein